MSGTAKYFHKLGKESATKKYRGILHQVKTQNEDIEKKHQAELQKYSISDQMELLDLMAQKGVSYFTHQGRRNDSRSQGSGRRRSRISKNNWPRSSSQSRSRLRPSLLQSRRPNPLPSWSLSPSPLSLLLNLLQSLREKLRQQSRKKRRKSSSVSRRKTTSTPRMASLWMISSR